MATEHVEGQTLHELIATGPVGLVAMDTSIGFYKEAKEIRSYQASI